MKKINQDPLDETAGNETHTCDICDRQQDWTQFLPPGHRAGGTGYDGSDIDSYVCITCAEKDSAELAAWEAEQWLDTCPNCVKRVADLTDAGVCDDCHMAIMFPNPTDTNPAIRTARCGICLQDVDASMATTVWGKDDPDRRWIECPRCATQHESADCDWGRIKQEQDECDAAIAVADYLQNG